MKENMAAFAEKHTVLVVEDNEMNREILCDLLSDEFEVLQAENGLEGLLQLEAHGRDISVILLDVYMPECSGVEFLERRRMDGRYESLPVIMMTASDSVEDEIRCLEMGASDFVTKPYNIEVVKNRIKSMIRLRESASLLTRLETDKLTGFYSKEFFVDNAARILQSAADGSFDLVLSDIDNFRSLNERYGREQCDGLLRHVAERLPQILPGCLIGGRLGPDVFAFVVEHQERPWGELLRDSTPLQEGQSINFNMKYGVVQALSQDISVDDSCDHASLALRKIKGNFKLQVAVYDEAMRLAQQREHQLVEFAEPAIHNREFQIYYQPKHSLATDKTGGAEALVRWIHPQLGFISPGMFIPLFERNGFITRLDFYIWEEVCRELCRLRELGLPSIPVSVNVSRMDFDVPNLAERISELADRYGVDHSLLHIELTESIYGDDPTQIARVLDELHNNGFIIELDDFGSGYSSLTSLNTLTLDVMKLDMSIIRQASATGDYGILRFATLLADGMRLKTVAEGVETADQVEALKVLGCDYIQGYFYSKPLPAADFEAYLAKEV